MIGRLNHVAIAVPDLEAARHFYRVILGGHTTDPVDLVEHGVRVCVVTLPNCVIELMHPLNEQSPITSFLTRNPKGGTHHICYEVDDIIAARDQLVAKGIRVVGDGMPKTGYHGNPVLFFHPSDCLGTLIELEQTAL